MRKRIRTTYKCNCNRTNKASIAKKDTRKGNWLIKSRLERIEGGGIWSGTDEEKHRSKFQMWNVGLNKQKPEALYLFTGKKTKIPFNIEDLTRIHLPWFSRYSQIPSIFRKIPEYPSFTSEYVNKSPIRILPRYREKTKAKNLDMEEKTTKP